MLHDAVAHVTAVTGLPLVFDGPTDVLRTGVLDLAPGDPTGPARPGAGVCVPEV